MTRKIKKFKEVKRKVEAMRNYDPEEKFGSLPSKKVSDEYVEKIKKGEIKIEKN